MAREEAGTEAVVRVEASTVVVVGMEEAGVEAGRTEGVRVLRVEVRVAAGRGRAKGGEGAGEGGGGN